MENLTLKTITKSDTFYDVVDDTIIKCNYLCEFPNNDKYHILINANSEKPERWCFKKLRQILDKNIRDYKTANKLVIANLQKKLVGFGSNIKIKDNG